MSIRARLQALEKAMNARYQPGLHVTLIEGGIPWRGGIRHAQGGGLTWERMPDETLEDFTRRAADEAIAADVQCLVVGGLAGPMPDTLEDFLDMLHFDEVPPEEGHEHVH